MAVRRFIALSFVTLLAGCSQGPPAPPAVSDAQAPPAAAPVRPTEPAAPASKGRPELQGTWRVTAIEHAGVPVPEDQVQAMELRYVFTGDQVTATQPFRLDKVGTYLADDAKSPPRIALMYGVAPPIRAVYRVTGDRLEMCVMVDEQRAGEYPTEIASLTEPKTDLYTLRREAPAR